MDSNLQKSSYGVIRPNRLIRVIGAFDEALQGKSAGNNRQPLSMQKPLPSFRIIERFSFTPTEVYSSGSTSGDCSVQ